MRLRTLYQTGRGALWVLDLALALVGWSAHRGGGGRGGGRLGGPRCGHGRSPCGVTERYRTPRPDRMVNYAEETPRARE